MYKSYCNITTRFLKPSITKINPGANYQLKTIHKSPTFKYPQVTALKLPTNVVNINEAEIGRFCPLRVRDISGPVINAHSNKYNMSRIDITLQPDPHVNKYDCLGAVNLSSSMQSNVPSPFSGNSTHLSMPGSQWGQGYKYLSDHLHNAHYLSLRIKYLILIILLLLFQSIVITVSARNMSTNKETTLSTKEKFKKAIKDYGSTVIIFHVTISLMSLGGCYIIVSSGVDVGAILKYFNMSDGTQASAVASNAGTFVIAYGIHKLFAPVRLAVTLTATPFIVRYLRKVGMLKNNVSGGGK